MSVALSLGKWKPFVDLISKADLLVEDVLEPIITWLFAELYVKLFVLVTCLLAFMYGIELEVRFVIFKFGVDKVELINVKSDDV